MKKIFLAAVGILAFCTSKAQNVGIGTTEPLARLHAAEGNVLFSSRYGLPGNPAPPPAISSTGRFMMWYADKAAFRAGFNSESYMLNAENIGRLSFAFGQNVLAQGDYSFSMGLFNSVSGNYSVAMGKNNTVSGFAAVAFGNNTSAAGVNAVALGSFAVASGNYSFAANRSTSAVSAYETVFGQYNTTYTPSSTTEWVPSDRLFVVGNGVSSSQRGNALTIFKNGNIGISTAIPNARLSVNGDASKSGGGVWAAWSDARLKKNITPYTSGLKEILQINPIRFQYNELSGEEDLNKNYVGILAQEIENILPSTITIKADEQLKDKRMFDGSELIYTLINAIKEQQVLINELQQENKTVLEKLNSIKINQTER